MRISSLRCCWYQRRNLYTLCRILESDKKPVLEFLNKYYFRDEPLTSAVGLLDQGPMGRCEEMDDYAASFLKDQVSIAALDEEENFVGVSINTVVTRDSKPCEENFSFEGTTKNICNPKFMKIYSVLQHLEAQAKIWERVPKTCQKILEVKIVSTHPHWRRKGVMTAMCIASENLAKNIGVGVIRLDSTSAIATLIAERLLYKKIYGVEYKNLPFAPQPKPPHVKACVYIKEL